MRHNEIERYAEALAAATPRVTLQRYAQTHEGRDMYALKISDNVDQDEDELPFLLIAAQHCREIGTHVAALTAAQKS